MTIHLWRIFLLSIASYSVRAASPPTEIADVRWGASPAAVRDTISRRPGVKFVEQSPDRLTFAGGTFAGHAVETWRFEFRAAKFCKVTVAFERPKAKDTKGNWLVDHIWGDLQKLLAEKYGRGEKLSDGSHGEFLWTFPDPSRRGATKTIDLYYGFGTRLDITYSDNPPSATPSPVPKANAKKDI